MYIKNELFNIPTALNDLIFDDLDDTTGWNYDNLLSCLYRFGKVAGNMVFWLIGCQMTVFMADMSKGLLYKNFPKKQPGHHPSGTIFIFHCSRVHK